MLSFNRPTRRNSLTDPIVYALTDTMDAAASDESVRVIHLQGEGDHFCSGFDLAERTPGPERPRVGSVHRRMNGHVNRLIPAMLTLPDTDRLHGAWLGDRSGPRHPPGLGLRRRGRRCQALGSLYDLWFTPDSGATWLIPRLAGVARAREMLMLGEKVSGEDAASWGPDPPRCTRLATSMPSPMISSAAWLQHPPSRSVLPSC